jgi:hypothetical protein
MSETLNPQEQSSEQTGLLPCPFCKVAIVESWDRTLIGIHPITKSCILSGVEIGKHEGELWNKRVSR